MTEPRTPRLYTIPAGEPFLIRLAEAILAGQLPHDGLPAPDPVALSAYTVLVPTRRAARALAEAFLEAGDGRAMLLPRIRPIGDVDEDDLLISSGTVGTEADDAGILAAAGTLDMRLMIAREILALVRDAESSDSGFHATPAQALHLADELAGLIDAFDTEEIDLSDIAGLVADEYAHHWAQTLTFLEVITMRLPSLLAERGLLGPAARRNRLLDAEVARLRADRPVAPVIAAGSTGSIPATARLLTAIADLENGAVVLPGLDLDLEEAGWDDLPPSHPQYGMAALLRAMGAERDAVLPVPGTAGTPQSRTRFRVLNEALRPAETTEAWRTAGGRIAQADLAEAMDGLEVIVAPTPREEALAVAMILREAIETPGRTAALVTPDRGLARRVAAELRRWDIAADDSAGASLAHSEPGTLLLAVADVLTERFSPTSLLTLLKHPLATFGFGVSEVRRIVGLLERAALRGPRPQTGVTGLRAAVTATRRRLESGARVHRSLKGTSDRDWGDVDRLLQRIAEALDPLVNVVVPADEQTLGELLAAHAAAAEAVSRSRDDDGEDRIMLWLGDAGEMLAGFLADIVHAPDAAMTMGITDYRPFLAHLLRSGVVRPRYRAHPRISIWGLLEARLLSADVTVLGGLNESVWPPTATVDAWLNRPMRQALGLQPPERRIGLTAHDFVQAACGSVVHLTRSQKADGAPTVPSRWLLRLRALLAGLHHEGAVGTADTSPWLSWLQGLDGGDPDARPVGMPRPTPPVEARPRSLSVTRVEDWIRDPYSVFARHILKLEPLDPVDADPGAADRGTAIHEILHQFTRTYPGPLPDDALDHLSRIGRSVFEQLSDRPGVFAFWWPRFLRAAAWFVEQEADLRRGVARQETEIGGALLLPGAEQDFTVTARADRIDLLDDGQLRICDYKTGAIPSEKEVRSGFAPQLSLEAAIAAAGGFEGVGRHDVAELAYIGLSGGDPPGDMRRFADSMALAQDAIAGLARLIADYDRPETPYISRVAVKFEQRTYDYDHLARHLEWSLHVPETGERS